MYREREMKPSNIQTSENEIASAHKDYLKMRFENDIWIKFVKTVRLNG